MRYYVIGLIVILGICLSFQADAILDGKKPADIDWKNIDAIEAMAIANEWKWSQKDVKSFVNANEVVFEFADGTTKEIPLPIEKMLVAVAPYIQSTHQ